MESKTKIAEVGNSYAIRVNKKIMNFMNLKKGGIFRVGIHTWDGYSEYESKALRSYIETIERFCSECHTNEDYNGCENCPTGIFIGQLRKYLIEASEIMENYKFRDPKDEKTEFMIKIRKLIQKIPKLHPLYLPVDEEYEFNSVFNKLKKLSFEFELLEECFRREFEWKMHIAELMNLGKKMKKKGKKEKKNARK